MVLGGRLGDIYPEAAGTGVENKPNAMSIKVDLRGETKTQPCHPWQTEVDGKA